MSGNEDYPIARRVLKGSIAVAICTCVLSALVTWLASTFAGINAVAQWIVDAASIVPARYLGRASDYPELSAVYYFFSSPVFVASSAATFAQFCFPFVNRFGKGFTMWLRVRTAAISIFILALSVTLLWAFDGSDVRSLSFGTNFAVLLTCGWVIFALTGFVCSCALIGLHESIFPSKKEL
jgi:hypothetical protein